MSDSSDDEIVSNGDHREERNDVEETEASDTKTPTFAELGIRDVLCEACTRLGWNMPTKIQAAVLPHALAGRDVIGLAETGSGKTAAFVLPIMQSLMESPQRLYALVLTPTRELAIQVAEHFDALGASIGLLTAVIIGGGDMVTQTMALAKRPHVIVATPGRLVDHLENTKGFNLRALKYLVLDEADRMLTPDFEVEFDKIIRVIPRERRTFLFSATMTQKVSKLERASLKDPARVEVSTKYKTVDTLKQSMLFIPQRYKETYLIYILNEKAGNTSIIFCSTCAGVMKLALMLRHLGFGAVPLHGQMSQAKRLGSLNKFKSKDRPIMVCTDVASRGLDIPHVDIVINYDVPTQSKDYIHRVGRTARAGRAGISLTFVTQYDVELYQRIERIIGKKLEKHQVNDDDVMILVERVNEAMRYAIQEIKEQDERKKGKKRKVSDDEDAEENANMKYRKKIKIVNKGKKGGKKYRN